MNNETAFPWVSENYAGLTKRELIAAMAMQGYNACHESYEASPEDKAIWSVQDADALLAELKKGECK